VQVWTLVHQICTSRAAPLTAPAGIVSRGPSSPCRGNLSVPRGFRLAKHTPAEDDLSRDQTCGFYFVTCQYPLAFFLLRGEGLKSLQVHVPERYEHGEERDCFVHRHRAILIHRTPAGWGSGVSTPQNPPKLSSMPSARVYGRLPAGSPVGWKRASRPGSTVAALSLGAAYIAHGAVTSAADRGPLFVVWLLVLAGTGHRHAHGGRGDRPRSGARDPERGGPMDLGARLRRYRRGLRRRLHAGDSRCR